MFRQLLICIAFLFATAESIAPSAPSDVELSLRPPEESVRDIQESFNALLKSEEISRKTSQADYAADRKRMLEAERWAIQGIVEHAMQPLLTKAQSQ